MIIKTASLTPEIKAIVIDRGTEHPFSGDYNDLDQPGTYLCRQCGHALFRAQSKFHSGCGWPSFDEEIKDAVTKRPDPDGKRCEIICAHCQAHLGHVFEGEGFTPKNNRHCVNSYSLDFISNQQTLETEEAIFAAGCFWGVEHYFKTLAGVVKTEVGYSGGNSQNPSYQDICEGNTGHLEVIRVVFDPTIVTYEEIVKYFFEIHDPTQEDGQGPDIGTQYLSAIFYYNQQQKQVAENLIKILMDKHYAITTKLIPVSIFWPAENYHQDYYAKTGKTPYCHHYSKRF